MQVQDLPPVHVSKPSVPVLVFTIGDVACALPIAHVIETMRVLPIEAPAGASLPFASGVSTIRGTSVPVVDLAVLLGRQSAPARFVTVRAGGRTAALAVTGVRGVERLDVEAFERLAPMLAQAEPSVVESVTRMDRYLSAVLETARLVDAAGGGA